MSSEKVVKVENCVAALYVISQERRARFDGLTNRFDKPTMAGSVPGAVPEPVKGPQ